MEHDAFFNTDENRMLMAIGIRKFIRHSGIVGACIGFLLLVFPLQFRGGPYKYATHAMLGLLLLAWGISAIYKPSRRTILEGVFIAGLALILMLITWIPYLDRGQGFALFIATGLFTVSSTLFTYYRKSERIRRHIDSQSLERIDGIHQLREQFKKMKQGGDHPVVQDASKTCRAQLQEDRAFFIQRDLLRAFIGRREHILKAVAKPAARRWKLSFAHPLGEIVYRFDQKNTAKLKQWLAAELAPESTPTLSA